MYKFIQGRYITLTRQDILPWPNRYAHHHVCDSVVRKRKGNALFMKGVVGGVVSIFPVFPLVACHIRGTSIYDVRVRTRGLTQKM